jgi:hypothetical protein
MSFTLAIMSISSSVNSVIDSLEAYSIDETLDEPNVHCSNSDCNRIKRKSATKLQKIRDGKRITSGLWGALGIITFVGFVYEVYNSPSSSSKSQIKST